MRYRTSRSTHESGRAAQVSRVSHEGQVFGFNHATSWSSTPRALSQRDRGMPLTAAVRRTLGLTNGRPGVKSTICRAPTRSTACTPAWTRRATWAYEHSPRSATSTSPSCKLGWTACTGARSWGRRGAMTSLRSTPLPAWNSPRSRATGKPHPGVAPTAGQTPVVRQAYRAWSSASHRPKSAVAMPSPFVQGGLLHRAAEALQEEGKKAQRESGAGLTVGRRTEPQARQMGQMAAGGVAMQNLPQEELDGGDR